jgi:hypothetical protein
MDLSHNDPILMIMPNFYNFGAYYVLSLETIVHQER